MFLIGKKQQLKRRAMIHWTIFIMHLQSKAINKCLPELEESYTECWETPPGKHSFFQVC